MLTKSRCATLLTSRVSLSSVLMKMHDPYIHTLTLDLFCTRTVSQGSAWAKPSTFVMASFYHTYQRCYSVIFATVWCKKAAISCHVNHYFKNFWTFEKFQLDVFVANYQFLEASVLLFPSPSHCGLNHSGCRVFTAVSSPPSWLMSPEAEPCSVADLQHFLTSCTVVVWVVYDDQLLHHWDSGGYLS